MGGSGGGKAPGRKGARGARAPQERSEREAVSGVPPVAVRSRAMVKRCARAGAIGWSVAVIVAGCGSGNETVGRRDAAGSDARDVVSASDGSVSNDAAVTMDASGPVDAAVSLDAGSIEDASTGRDVAFADAAHIGRLVSREEACFKTKCTTYLET